MIHQGVLRHWKLFQREGIPQFSTAEHSGCSRPTSRVGGVDLRTYRLLLALGSMLASLVCPSVFAQILNGSFESAAQSWSFTGGLSILGPTAGLPPLGIDGNHCASIGGADIPNSTLSQTFPVVPGTN